MTKLSIIDHLKVLFLFSLLAIVLTSPLILNMNNVDGLDDYMFVFSFWWFKKAIFSFQNPFFTDFMFFPEGTSLAFHATTFSNFVLTLPFSMLFGVNVAVNVAYMLTMVLSGYTAFLLSYELTGNKHTSVIAGLIFAFNPFHFSQGRDHLHISTLQWIPLYLLAFKRAVEGAERKWAVFAGLVLGWIILTDQMQTICVGLITISAILFLAFQRGLDFRKTSVSLLVIVAVAGLVGGFYLYEAVRELINNPLTTKLGPMEHGGANTFSGDLLGYFVPPQTHPVWGKLFAPISPGGESTLFFGYIPLSLAIIGAFKFFKNGLVKYMAFLSIIFWILSLGTYLHINGVWEWSGSSYALPFLYLTDMPVIGDIRTPSRFHMITILGIALLAAYGTTVMLQNTRAKGSAPLSVILAVLILIEFMPPSQPVEATHTPALFNEMAKDKEPYTVLVLPLARWSVYRHGSGSPAIPMYFQTIHGKRIFNGYISRAPMEALVFKEQLLNLFVQLSTQDNFRIGRKQGEPTEAEFSQVRQMARELSKGSEEFFKRYDIRYIVLHEPISWNNTLSRVFVEGFTGKSLIDVPDDNIAYVRVQ